ncbi:MAG: leucyl aminopeptidase [FCB group bacterium]|nr:leucyl aminopeptidase [FCB group bacterium]
MAHVKAISNSTEPWTSLSANLFAIGLFDDHSLTDVGVEVDQALNGQIRHAIELGDLKGKADETALFYYHDKRILVVGLGEKEKFGPEALRRAGGTVAKTAISKKIGTISMEVFGGNNSAVNSQALVEGVILGSYQFLDYKTREDDIFTLEEAVILNGSEDGIGKGHIIADVVCRIRDLENHPGNVTTPTKLAEEAKQIAEEGGMKLTVYEREEFTAMGMGGLAAVASGTEEPPKFIVLEYWGDRQDQKPVALVGKGLTFDSGGLSIKPASKMDEMKFDMCGAGVVLGVMHAVAAIKPKMNIVAVIPSTENLSGGKAYKPGDILKAYNGKTIEVLNTDAEGRLILADGLSYVSKHYDPEYVLDFATLTGAVITALGHVATGIMGTDPALIERVKAASEATGEKVWELPLWEEYCEQVKSKIADVKNIGAPRQAGTIAGGAFLKEFVGEDIPWVHFDIAGTAWGSKEKPYTPKRGATGELIRLVLNLIGV